MTVIGVNGSPRQGGNTAGLINEVLTAAGRTGAETRLLQLGRMDLSPCTACMACKATSRCAVEDDMQDFYSAIESGDGPHSLVVGTPIYFDHVSAQLKMWIDRLFCYTFTERGEKAFPKGVRAVVAATWEWDKEDAYDSVIEWLVGRLEGYHEIDVVARLKMHGAGLRPLAGRAELLRAAREAGRTLAGA